MPMENDKGSSEVISLSATNGGEDIPLAPLNTKVSANGEKMGVDTAGNLVDEEPHVEKIIPHETYNIDVPEFLAELPPPINKDTSTKKEVASTDAPDGFNGYRNKKTFTQGMMDVALFSANINQLRSVMDQMDHTKSIGFVCILIFMLIVSIVLQIGVGLLLLLSTRYDVNDPDQRKKAYSYGDYVVAGIFLVTVANIFIAAFGTPNDRYDSGWGVSNPNRTV